MADQSISQLPVATTLTGDELAVVVQNGITKQTQVADIANAVAPGKFIDYLYFDTGSDLIVVYTDTTTQNLGPIPGYIAAEINSVGHLILTNSDGGTTDAGSVFASLTQTFTTVNNETATLPNSQQLVAGANISLTSGTNTLTIAASGSAGSLNSAGTGIIVKDTSTSVVARTLTSTAGISITNPDGLAGNPIISPASKLANIQNLATTGILAVVGGTTVVDRNIVGTASQITVVGGDGSANPTISIASNPVLPGTGSFVVPTGDTAQRPGALAGQLRFNTSLNVFEGQNNSGVWQTLALGGGVTSVGSGTGLTGGPITSTGTLSIANTGVTAATYGSASTVPQIAVNAQGQITSASNVTITPSGIGAISSVSGTANEITATTVGTAVTVSLPTALTFTGKTVTGGTLTGVSINGSTNTLTNIANASLTNSSLTVGTTAISLGATSLTLGGLTSVAVTQDPVSALQLATKQYVDNIAQGLNTKAPVLVATTANITLSGEQTIDGFTTSLSRVLVKNQTLPANNGIYLSNPAAWTRALDADTWNELVSAYVFVEEGTINGDTGWVCTVDPGGTLGVTAVTWVQFSGAGTYTAGTGLTLTGTQFSITNTGTAGTYGSSTLIPVITTNAQGHVTSVTTASNPQGTVTSVAALTLGTTGTDLSSSVATGTTTPVITLNVPTASATNRGALSSTDWTTFNNKQPAGTYVTSVTGTSPVVSSGGTTPVISMPAATTSVSGYLTSTDWNTFNGKGSGSVTSITAGTGLSGGTITTTGTIALANTTVTAGSYTTANITVDAQGRITAASNGSAGVTTISFGTTGLTPNTATSGAVTVAGTLATANGGTGTIYGVTGGTF